MRLAKRTLLQVMNITLLSFTSIFQSCPHVFQLTHQDWSTNIESDTACDEGYYPGPKNPPTLTQVPLSARPLQHADALVVEVLDGKHCTAQRVTIACYLKNTWTSSHENDYFVSRTTTRGAETPKNTGRPHP